MGRNFARALSLVLKHEGGWADHPKDPGGATMKGVTLANYRRYVNPNATKADLRKITDAELSMIYRRFYWDAVKADQMPDGVDYAVFDYAVNSGPSRAVKHLQEVVGVAQDGLVGPMTLAAVKARKPSDVINVLCDRRMRFLKALSTWGTFGKGWTNRVVGVRKDALSMVAAGFQSAPLPDVAPTPQPKPDTPLKPVSGGLVALIIAAFAAIGSAVAGGWDWLTGLFQ